jgi:hypothetical protein
MQNQLENRQKRQEIIQKELEWHDNKAHRNEGLAIAEVKRLFKPNGRATFSEPFAHHLLIWLGRRLTPQLRTQDEHPLTIREMSRFGKAFGTPAVETFFLFAPLADGVRALPKGENVFQKLHKFLSGVARQIFKKIRATKWVALYGVVNVFNHS